MECWGPGAVEDVAVDEKTGAAGGFAGWRRGAREVLLEDSLAGTGSEGGAAGVTAGIREG